MSDLEVKRIAFRGEVNGLEVSEWLRGQVSGLEVK